MIYIWLLRDPRSSENYHCNSAELLILSDVVKHEATFIVFDHPKVPMDRVHGKHPIHMFKIVLLFLA
jgi:hypothetical protein